MSLQVVFSTDGVSSFAAFLYNDPTFLDITKTRQIGFDAGDRLNASVVVNLGLPNSGIMSTTNIFRIDGMLLTYSTLIVIT